METDANQEDRNRISTKHECRIEAGRRGYRARRIPRTGPVKKMEPATTTRGASAAASATAASGSGAVCTVQRAPGRAVAIAASAATGIARGSGRAVQTMVAVT